MSAYLVSDTYISAILRPLYPSGRMSTDLVDDAQARGEVLYAQNLASVNCRYAHRADLTEHQPLPFKFDQTVPLLTPIEVLRLLDCLEHQSSETEHYYSAPGYEVLAQVRNHFIRKLPGYKEARRDL